LVLLVIKLTRPCNGGHALSNLIETSIRTESSLCVTLDCAMTLSAKKQSGLARFGFGPLSTVRNPLVSLALQYGLVCAHVLLIVL
jgi:hypothetical protein